MTRQQVYSRWHAVNWGEDYSALPLYVLADQLIALLGTTANESSVYAMADAGVAHLPYPRMRVEFWTGRPWRVLGVVKENRTGEFAMSAVLQSSMGTSESVLFGMHVVGGDEPGVRTSLTSPHMNEELRSMLVPNFAGALCVLLLAGHVSELEREVVEPRALNRSRVASGKVPVATHTLLRIGHVYDRQGRRVAYEPGRRMPVHMRAGHTRRQQHGEDWRAANPGSPWVADDHHPVWIPPVLVNYDTGEDLAVPLPKEVRW